jgi:CRP/FNR family cyclic AMP-dependent transcriptional regulator
MDEARLRSIPLFEGLGKKERREVAKQADEVDVEPGRHLVREGEFAYEFFAELGPGDFFGEMGLIGQVTRNASVTATSPVTVLVLTGSAFRHIERELPAVSKKIRKAIEERCHQLEAVA